MTGADYCDVARKVVDTRIASNKDAVKMNGVLFRLNETSMCSKFVRQCYQVVTGIEWPEWAGQFAIWSERELQKYKVSARYPGCIVCFNTPLYTYHGLVNGRPKVWDWSAEKVKSQNAYGHIGIYMGSDMVAENTSATRGTPDVPGTKITQLREIGANRVSGYYGVFPQDTDTRDTKVSIPKYAVEAVEKAKELGIVTDLFDQPLKRYDLCVILDRLGLLKGKE